MQENEKKAEIYSRSSMLRLITDSSLYKTDIELWRKKLRQEIEYFDIQMKSSGRVNWVNDTWFPVYTVAESSHPVLAEQSQDAGKLYFGLFIMGFQIGDKDSVEAISLDVMSSLRQTKNLNPDAGLVMENGKINVDDPTRTKLFKTMRGIILAGARFSQVKQ